MEYCVECDSKDKHKDWCSEAERNGSKSLAADGSAPKLICTVCLEAYEGEEGFTFCCDECGQCGFCEHCAKPENHDCE